jgi:hypothetical protein
MYLHVEVTSESKLNVQTVQSLGKEYQFLDIFLIKLVNSKILVPNLIF